MTVHVQVFVEGQDVTKRSQAQEGEQAARHSKWEYDHNNLQMASSKWGM